MPLLPRPPWARPRERCPNCLAKTPDERALVCDRCGYQLRLPRIAIAGLALIAASLASFFVSVFGGYLFSWPDLSLVRPLLQPLIGSPTPADLANLYFWAGIVLVLAGMATAFGGARAVRRKSDRVLSGGGPA